MSTWRVLLVVGLTIAILPVGAMAVLVGPSEWALYRFHQDSPLPAGSQGKTYKELGDDFQRRVREAFLIGTPAKDLQSILLKQHFKSGIGQLMLGSSLILEIDDGPCNDYWEVSWSEDKAGLITAVGAELNPRCL